MAANIISDIKNNKEEDTINPLYKDEISIVFSTDAKFMPYLLVSIKSLVENISPDNKYVLYILHSEIPDKYKNLLSKICTKNVNIRYVNINKYMSLYKESLFYVPAHLALPTYFRFFIPIIFKNFEKVLYCDCDLVFLADIAKLYEEDMNGYVIGAIHDAEVICQLNNNERIEYYYKFLKLNEPYNYFQCGVLLFHVQNAINHDFTKKCIETLDRLKTPRYADQCILNVVCERHVKFIDSAWNVENCVIISRSKKELEMMFCGKEFFNGLKHPKIMHFAGNKKPWEHVFTPNAYYFWKYAAKVPSFWEIIKNLLYKNMLRIILLLKVSRY